MGIRRKTSERLRKRARDLSLSVYKEKGYICLWCGVDIKPLSEIPEEERLDQPKPNMLYWKQGNRIMRTARATIDHIIPLWRGGTNDRDNLAPSCWTCNMKRGRKDEQEMLKEQRAIEESLNSSSSE